MPVNRNNAYTTATTAITKNATSCSLVRRVSICHLPAANRAVRRRRCTYSTGSAARTGSAPAAAAARPAAFPSCRWSGPRSTGCPAAGSAGCGRDPGQAVQVLQQADQLRALLGQHLEAGRDLVDHVRDLVLLSGQRAGQLVQPVQRVGDVAPACVQTGHELVDVVQQGSQLR